MKQKTKQSRDLNRKIVNAMAKNGVRQLALIRNGRTYAGMIK